MREAIGGAAIFNIVIVVIVFFNTYLAISVNYSKAYRVKNEVISIIEQQEGWTNRAKDEIDAYLTSVGYSQKKGCGACTGTCYHSYCVLAHNVPERDGASWYSVTTYMNVDIPMIGQFTSIPIKGETKMIYKF